MIIARVLSYHQWIMDQQRRTDVVHAEAEERMTYAINVDANVCWPNIMHNTLQIFASAAAV